MQGNCEVGKRFEYFEERQVAVLVRVFEDAIKVANRLMIVKNKAKLDWWITHYVFSAWQDTFGHDSLDCRGNNKWTGNPSYWWAGATAFCFIDSTKLMFYRICILPTGRNIAPRKILIFIADAPTGTTGNVYLTDIAPAVSETKLPVEPLTRRCHAAHMFCDPPKMRLWKSVIKK